MDDSLACAACLNQMHVPLACLPDLEGIAYPVFCTPEATFKEQLCHRISPLDLDYSMEFFDEILVEKAVLSLSSQSLKMC